MHVISADSPMRTSYYATHERRRSDDGHIDTKNEIGFYLGDKKGMKGGFHVYQPCYHKILTRGDVHRVCIFEIELMEWYGKRAHVRQSGLSWGMVEEAIIDLLKDKPYMNASALRRGNRRLLRRQQPGRHGTGATTHAKSSRTATTQYAKNSEGTNSMFSRAATIEFP